MHQPIVLNFEFLLLSGGRTLIWCLSRGSLAELDTLTFSRAPGPQSMYSPVSDHLQTPGTFLLGHSPETLANSKTWL